MNTTEGNKLIAEFMGSIRTQSGDVDDMPYYEGVGMLGGYLDNFQYHISWDWLMPAYKKFSSLQGQPMPSFMVHVRNISAWVERVDIQEAHRFLCIAIEWYNEINQP